MNESRTETKGKYYQLPIIGLRISKLIFDGIVRIGFGTDDTNRILDLHGEFKLIGFGKDGFTIREIRAVGKNLLICGKKRLRRPSPTDLET